MDQEATPECMEASGLFMPQDSNQWATNAAVVMMWLAVVVAPRNEQQGLGCNAADTCS